MPAPGTKQIELDGHDVYLPAADVELEELIAAGVAAEKKLAEDKRALDVLKARAIALAEHRRNGEKSVYLEAPRAGFARVTWSTEINVLDEKAALLEEGMPPTVFAGVFVKRTVYSLTSGYRRFMETPQAPEMEKLKLRVAKTLDVKPKKPSVAFGESHE